MLQLSPGAWAWIVRTFGWSSMSPRPLLWTGGGRKRAEPEGTGEQPSVFYSRLRFLCAEWSALRPLRQRGKQPLRCRKLRSTQHNVAIRVSWANSANSWLHAAPRATCAVARWCANDRGDCGCSLFAHRARRMRDPAAGLNACAHDADTRWSGRLAVMVHTAVAATASKAARLPATCAQNEFAQLLDDSSRTRRARLPRGPSLVSTPAGHSRGVSHSEL